MSCRWRVIWSASMVIWVGALTVGLAQTRTIADGVFNEEQATRGDQAYKKTCAHCHSADLLGSATAPPLVGPGFLTRWDGSTVDDVVQTIKRTMPQEAPDSLSLATYVDIVTFVLKTNGSPEGNMELAADAAELKQIFVKKPGLAK